MKKNAEWETGEGKPIVGRRSLSEPSCVCPAPEFVGIAGEPENWRCLRCGCHPSSLERIHVRLVRRLGSLRVEDAAASLARERSELQALAKEWDDRSAEHRRARNTRSASAYTRCAKELRAKVRLDGGDRD